MVADFIAECPECVVERTVSRNFMFEESEGPTAVGALGTDVFAKFCVSGCRSDVVCSLGCMFERCCCTCMETS